MYTDTSLDVFDHCIMLWSRDRRHDARARLRRGGLERPRKRGAACSWAHAYDSTRLSARTEVCTSSCGVGRPGGRGRSDHARQAQPGDGGVRNRAARHPHDHLRQRRCACCARPCGPSPCACGQSLFCILSGRCYVRILACTRAAPALHMACRAQGKTALQAKATLTEVRSMCGRWNTSWQVLPAQQTANSSAG